MKTCKQCKKDFIPSSRHFKCPMCRHLEKMKPCCDCGSLIRRQVKRCRSCAIIHRTGIKQPKDKFTGFREFIRRAKNRKKLGNLTLDDLIRVWEQQQGKCPYSGVQLMLPSYRKKNDVIHVASLDRIDSLLPYSGTNVQFVSVAINYMKGELTHEQTIELCRIISANWS